MLSGISVLGIPVLGFLFHFHFDDLIVRIAFPAVADAMLILICASAGVAAVLAATNIDSK